MALKKLALITGSSIRTGKFLVESLVKEGWRVAIHCHHSKEEAECLVKQLSLLSDVQAFEADLSRAHEAEEMFSDVELKMGEVELLINNASLYKNDGLFELTEKNINDNFNIHVFSPLNIGRKMKKGNVINIIDADFVHNMDKFFSYSLSKKSLFQLTKMMAYSMAPNVRVNAIAPGPMLFKEGQNKELFDSLVKSSPLQNKAELEDLYKTVKFLLNTPCITGQCIFLDGGRHLL